MTYRSLKRYPGRASRVAFGMLLAVGTLMVSEPAGAVQPLRDFLAAAEHANYDVRQSDSLAQQRRYEAQASTGRLLPVLGLTGAYTRNQYSASLPVGSRFLKIAPYDQLDAAANLTVPVVDVVSWARRAVAHHQSAAATAQQQSGRLGVAKQVAQQYYGLRANEGVLASAQNSLSFAEHNVALIEARRAAGTASALDWAHAESDRAQAVQQVAEAQLQVVLMRRNLETLTGLAAEASGPMPEVDLYDEAPLASWLAPVGPSLPQVADAMAQRRAARAGDNAARFGYMPVISLTASQRVTNATALNGGHPFVWQAKANLSWQLDGTLPATQKAQISAARTANTHAEQVQRQVADAIYADWSHIKAMQAQSRAARAQVHATKLAESLALEKVAAGVITQLDVTQTRRDAFGAEVNRISADANLLLYRTLLRLDSASSVTRFEEPTP